MQSIQRNSFPQNRFYGQYSSLRPPASVGVNIKQYYRRSENNILMVYEMIDKIE